MALFKKGEWMSYLAVLPNDQSLNLNVETLSFIKKVDKELQEKDNNFPPGYLIMKCLELRGEEAWRVPFKRSQGVLAKYDKRWKAICLDHGWEFIQSKEYTLKVER